MPIAKNWSTFTPEKVATVEADRGVYELGEAKTKRSKVFEVVYIGSSKDEKGLKDRIRDHFSDMPETVTKFRFLQADGATKAIHLEAWHVERFKSTHGGRLPKYQLRAPKFTPINPFDVTRFVR